MSVVTIFIGLALLLVLCYKGHSIVWVAPVCAAFVALCGGLNVLDAYTNSYMQGAADYFKSWFPAFFLGAVYGKVTHIGGYNGKPCKGCRILCFFGTDSS